MSYSIISLFALFTLISTSLCAPQLSRPSPDLKPLFPENFPDPSLIKLNDGSFYAFSTQSDGANVPVARSTDDIKSMSLLRDSQGKLQDAMPSLPPWTVKDNPSIWAPDVIQLKKDLFILYFSATSNESTSNQHCIGAATSHSVTGPYIPTDHLLACPLDLGGAIDPAGFIDSDGSVYVVYKIDGNSLGGGGPCGNQDGSHGTPLMLQQVSADDGYTPIGDKTQLLDRGEADGPLIEAPSLVRARDGTYVLFFSSNCYNTEFYDTSYATSALLKGPYTKASQPLLTTGLRGLQSPGGADVLDDGSRIVFHADLEPKKASVRQVYSVPMEIGGRSSGQDGFEMKLGL